MSAHGPEVPSISWLFREPSSLMTGVKLVRENPDIKKVAVIGCATGEQVYSLQTLFQTAAKRDDVEIDGFDTKVSVLDRAKEGVYHPEWKHLRNKQVQKLIESLFGMKTEGTQKTTIIPEQYRSGVTFGYHDIRFDPLPDMYQLIYCSNVLSYFIEGIDPHRQTTLSTILWNISQSLSEQGVLITEPTPEAFNAHGNLINTYLKAMEINPYFRLTPELVVPKYEYIEFPKKQRFIAEETKAYVKKL